MYKRKIRGKCENRLKLLIKIMHGFVSSERAPWSWFRFEFIFHWKLFAENKLHIRGALQIWRPLVSLWTAPEGFIYIQPDLWLAFFAVPYLNPFEGKFLAKYLLMLITEIENIERILFTVYSFSKLSFFAETGWVMCQDGKKKQKS